MSRAKFSLILGCALIAIGAGLVGFGLVQLFIAVVSP